VSHAPQKLLAFHLEFVVRRRDGLADCHRPAALSIRYQIANPLVRTLTIEEAAIAGECLLRAPQSEQDQMVKILSRYAAHPSFRVPVDIRCARWRLHYADFHPGKDPVEVMHKQRIVIMHNAL